MSLNVSGDEALVRRLAAVGDVRRTNRAILTRWRIRTTQLAKVNVAPHKRTGTLQRSIGPGELSDTRATVRATAAHAGYLEFGTRPHVIRPRNRRVLAWSDQPGATRLSGSMRTGFRPNVFARLVNHPGTAASPFLAPAARQALSEIDAEPIIEAWNGAA